MAGLEVDGQKHYTIPKILALIYMSYSLNSLQGLYRGLCRGLLWGLVRGILGVYTIALMVQAVSQVQPVASK